MLDMIESIVFTRLKRDIDESIKKKYPNINFTSEETANTPQFPNVYVSEIQSTEVGQTLENKNINGVVSGIQLTVTTNIGKKECKEVAWACVKVLKAMSYNIVSTPLYNKINDVHTYSIRARRTICEGDTL